MGFAGAPAASGESEDPERPNLTRSAVGGMAWVAWGSGTIAVLKVVVLVLLTRLLSPIDFGVVGAALVVIAFALNFSQLGLGPALVQRPALEPRHISAAFVASTGFGVIVGSLIWFGAPLIAQFFRIDQLTPVVRWLALVFPIAGLATVPESLLQRQLRFRFLAQRDVIAYGVGYGAVGVTLAVLGWGVWALVGGQLTQALIQLTFLLRARVPLLPARPTWRSFRELMEYGVGQSAARVAMILAVQADNLVVGRWLGAVALGLYSRAYQLMSVPTALLGDVLDKVLFPTLSRVQDDPRRLASAYLQGIAVIGVVTLPVGVVAAILAPELVVVAFGSKWVALIPPFQVLALGMMFRTSSRMSDSLSRATGRVYRRAWRQALYALLVFGGAYIGHYRGITGVAVGVLGALFINYLLMAHLSLSVGQITWSSFVKAQLPALGLATIVGAATLAAAIGTRRLGFPPLLGLLAGSAAAAATAALAVWLAPTLAIGPHGIRVRDTIRTFLAARLRPTGAGGSP